MMGYDSRKRPGSLPSPYEPVSSLTSATVYPPSTTAIPTSNSTANGSHRTVSYPFARHTRSPSPPSSAFFQSPSQNDHAPPQPTPDAGPHFSFSTTLRRHTGDHHSIPIFEAVQHDGINGFMHYFASLAKRITGGSDANDEEGGGADLLELTRRQDRKNSPSAVFSECTVEVKLWILRI
jgi:hypothetical protein